MRGLTKFYNYGNDSLSITDLLKKPEVTNYLEQGKKLTYASQREKIRNKLEKFGNNFKDIVVDYNLENPVEQEQQRQGQDTARNEGEETFREKTRKDVYYSDRKNHRDHHGNQEFRF